MCEAEVRRRRCGMRRYGNGAVWGKSKTEGYVGPSHVDVDHPLGSGRPKQIEVHAFLFGASSPHSLKERGISMGLHKGWRFVSGKGAEGGRRCGRVRCERLAKIL